MEIKRNMRGMKRHIRQPGLAFLAGWMLLALALSLIILPVQADSYYFAVPKATTDVYVNTDGTVTVDYDYIFDNQPGSAPIQYVDIGVPTTSYFLSEVTGTVNGQPVSVEDSSEVKGVALNLENLAIPAGQQGEVRAHIPNIRRMLFKADAQKTNKSEAYGSFQFEPNFFGSQYVTGQTDMTITLHLPVGMKQDEPVYFTPQGWPGQDVPDAGYDSNGGVYYTWQATNANISSQYKFGAAFPARLVPEGTLLTAIPSINIDLSNLCPWFFCLGFGGFMAFTVWASITGDRKRKLQYLPPKISVEGNGIKRGLTAVEAAILMGQPMDKILTMILFSVVKKSAAEVVSQNPMQLKVSQPLPEDLRTYESEFLQAMSRAGLPAQRAGLQDMMTNLVKSVSEKMRGFSRKETVDYYTSIMSKAWQQVEQAQTPEMKMQSFDDTMDWTMLDRRFNDRTRETFGPQTVFVPMWWGRLNPGFGGGMMHSASTAAPSAPRSSTGGAGNTPPTGVSLPSLPGGDFAASLANGMQSFSSSVVGDLAAFTGGVTNKTNPIPKPTTTSGGRGGGFGGGGGGCACACACAGCACACAGGGR